VLTQSGNSSASADSGRRYGPQRTWAGPQRHGLARAFPVGPLAPVELFEAFIRILFGGILTDDARRQFFAQEEKA